MLDIKEIKTIEHDVLIVGAGGAGLSAAIEASSQGMSVGIVMKSLLGKAHTVMAEGGMAAAWEMWIAATIGKFILEIPCAAGSSSTYGVWQSFTLNMRPTEFVCSKNGVLFLTEPKRG